MGRRIKRRHGSSKRRGALLLIVLSLLVLFLLVGLSFLVSATHFRDLAEATSRTHLSEHLGKKYTNKAMYQIVRGTKNPYSVVRGHSLLEDLYGRDYFVGRVRTAEYGDGSVASLTDNQFQEVQFDFLQSRRGSVPPGQLRDDYYGGCVMTFVTGDAAGQSVCILRFRNSATGGRTIKFGSVLKDASGGQMVPLVRVGDLFVVNGRPFNGTGAGYTTDDPRFTPLDQGPWHLNNGLQLGSHRVPVALAPNYTAYREIKPLEEVGFGGLDESWDGVDYQNLFLAKIPHEVEANVRQGSELRAATGSPNYLELTGGITPSFHRPYLLAYLQKHYPGLLEDPSFRRMFHFRPDVADHPGFSGSNVNYDPLLGPFDVDNDGDGVADSIWIDFGLEPVTGADGRLYKPLVAPLILDMDGKINLNTAGSLGDMQILKNRGANLNVEEHAIGPTSITFGTEWGGSGWGPADVSLRLAGEWETYERILRQRYLGLSERPGNAVPGDRTVGEKVDEYAIVDAAFHIRSTSSVPDQYVAGDQSRASGYQTSLDTGYGSFPDLHAKGTPFIGPTGATMWDGGSVRVGDLDSIDDPYEFNPLDPVSRDSLYTLEDLEFLLRFDDTRLSSRLRDIGRATRSSPFEVYNRNWTDGKRRLFTTHSVHIPTIPSLNPGPWRHQHGRSVDGRVVRGEGLQRSIREMFAAKIRRTREAGADSAATDQMAFALAGELLPPELARGEKLDINQALRGSMAEKRRFASHMFHLMMLLCDDGLDVPAVDQSLSREQRHELHVRRIAQWAINVVDFGDADSAMTFFEYDVNPFNSHRVNGDPLNNSTDSNDARRIWGCEHPELVLSETLAIHDRRVQDNRGVGGPRKEDGQIQDPHLDQYSAPPQGSLFIELLCMRGGAPGNGGTYKWRKRKIVGSRGPEDLYFTNAPSDRDQQWYIPSLDLARTDSLGNPVWRIAISERQMDSDVRDPVKLIEQKPDVTSFEPSDFSLLPAENPDIELTRFVWFTQPPTQSMPPPHTFFTDQYFYRNEEEKLARLSEFHTPVVEPGSYVVIGPESVTTIGLQRDAKPSQQQISVDTLLHLNLDGEQPRFPPPSRAVAIVAKNALGNGCNISEPIHGYPNARPDRFVPRDRPFDSPRNPANAEEAPLWYTEGDVPDEENRQLVTGTRNTFRTIYLQRLANPSAPWNPLPGRPGHNPSLRTPNPYITVDWMPVDLTVFNSTDEAPAVVQEPVDEPFDPQDPETVEGGLIPENLLAGIGETGYLASREKAGIQPMDFNIWSPRTVVGSSTAPKAGPRLTESTRNVVHTLGWLNRSFDYGKTNARRHYIQPGKLYPEAPNSRVTRRTFPTLVWNNRPYANAYELMLVPACSQARLGHEYTISRAAALNVPLVKGEPHPQSRDKYLGAFGHLLNFFNSSASGPEDSQQTAPAQAANFFRIFDFVGVPSRFRGTQHRYDTRRWNDDERIAPRNLATFREPGRVNLNTLSADRSSWLSLGVGSNHAGGAGSWKDLEAHMRGLTPNELAAEVASGTSIRLPNGVFPAEHPYPFRAAVSADLMPPLLTDTGAIRPPLPAVDATLLRTSRYAAEGQELLAGEPALAKYNSPSYFGPLRNWAQSRQVSAFFRYRDVHKIAGSVTAQSNVYAVWLTVGFFEIEPNYAILGQNADGALQYDFTRPFHVDGAHPHGYRYGEEVGSKTGHVTRYRSFYIVDRSVPVAFEPGENHNVDNAILLRRHLD